MRSEHDHEARRRDVLVTIIRQYIANGQPVGSKAVTPEVSETLSPATIRNVMAELEAEGFLAQPHTSAGRVPTEKAYRFYVDRIVLTDRLPLGMETYIDKHLPMEGAPPEEMMASASHILAKASNGIGLALGPAVDEKLFEHVKFVKLSDNRALVVIVSKPELIESRIIRMSLEVSQEELDRAANHLNAKFRGWSLRALRLEILRRAEDSRAFADALLDSITELLKEGAFGDSQPGALFVEGTARILNQLEFGDVHRIRSLLAALEEKARLTEILSSCLACSDVGVQVLIGRENPAREMQSCALVVAPLQYRMRTVGALAVVGPTRMEYGRAVPAVGYVAHRCSQVLSCN
jgi:heat-inducible transcriptional repressor